MELIEEMELWKWDDATRDFWSRLAKALQQSNISVTWAEQMDSRLESVHTTGKLSWAAATRSIRECKMRIERIGGSHLDTDSEVWGLDQTTWVLIKPHFFWRLSSQISFETLKENSMISSSKTRLKC